MNTVLQKKKFPTMLDQILAGKRVLVTGASSGIGAETAKLLASCGARVIVHYHHHKDAALNLVETIMSSGGEAVALCADLLNHESWHTLILQSIESLNGLDALVNNAGAIIGAKPILDLDRESWEQTFTLNVKVPFFLAQQAFAYMQKNRGGKIINISSIGVKYGGSSTSLHYSAAKAALETVTLGLAKAGAPYNILVNAIRPGFIATPFHASASPDAVERRIGKIPLQRAGDPLDIARMILFLLSPSGDYITGQIFSVTGGD